MAKTILIIDDELTTRDELKTILGDVYPLILTQDAIASTEILKNSADTIGLIIMGFSRLRDSTYNTFLEIKKQQPVIPVLVLTGHHDAEFAAQSCHHEAAGYLMKPCRPDDVLNAIKPYF